MQYAKSVSHVRTSKKRLYEEKYNREAQHHIYNQNAFYHSIKYKKKKNWSDILPIKEKWQKEDKIELAQPNHYHPLYDHPDLPKDLTLLMSIIIKKHHKPLLIYLSLNMHKINT